MQPHSLPPLTPTIDPIFKLGTKLYKNLQMSTRLLHTVLLMDPIKFLVQFMTVLVGLHCGQKLGVLARELGEDGVGQVARFEQQLGYLEELGLGEIWGWGWAWVGLWLKRMGIKDCRFVLLGIQTLSTPKNIVTSSNLFLGNLPISLFYPAFSRIS